VVSVKDFYDDPPVEIELVGGYFDGRRMRVPEDRDTWLFPVPVDIMLYAPEPDVTRLSVDIAVYRRTGSIRDDGTRVFRFAFTSLNR